MRRSTIVWTLLLGGGFWPGAMLVAQTAAPTGAPTGATPPADARPGAPSDSQRAPSTRPSDGSGRLPKPVPGFANRADADAPSVELGQRFESKTAGVSFRPPAICKEVKRPGTETIVEYINQEQGWLLRVTRATFPTPVQLKETRDKEGREVTGLLAYTVQQLKSSTPGAKVVREDMINVDSNYVGMIALRFTLGTQKFCGSTRCSR